MDATFPHLDDIDQHEHEGKRGKIRVQREGLRGGRGGCRGQDRRITNGTKVERGNTKNIEPPHLGFQISDHHKTPDGGSTTPDAPGPGRRGEDGKTSSRHLGP